MKYFLDTEFHEYKRDGVNTIELISIGIVGSDGSEFYAESLDFDEKSASENSWLKENVISNLWSRQADKSEFNRWIRDGGKGGLLHESEIAGDIRRFVGDKPEFYGYYADYDWVVFCWLFGRMIDLPEGFPMYCRDLKQMLDDYVAATWEAVSMSTWGHIGLTVEQVKALPEYPKQENEHNALADARWNMALYDFLVRKQSAATT
jgi:hypothetical protein